MLKVLVPEKQGIFRIAGNEFCSFWKRITGQMPEIVTKDDRKSDLIVLGSDAVNAFVFAKIMEKRIPPFRIRTNTDDYQLISAKEGRRNLLFIAGGRPRSLLYGIYHFFESQAGCHYFWDGDVIPVRKKIRISGIDIQESPRFEYRGLRYFAHRSLNRFQAEHWDFPEWKREIDWILKRRLNLFMLRIGLDDLFQKAFPEIVSYPGYEVPESKKRTFDDRNLFWSLKYRGKLRKRILAYARQRDLLHPEDVGTMTHWYSRTPWDFLNKVKPDFLPQTTRGYAEKTGLVWNIRKDKNLNNYFKLTETHIREYGAPDLFHTIGLAERRCFADHESNHQMKLYTYRRIISKLREKYPNAPLLVGSWDFCMHWTCPEVKNLVEELDPTHTLILDYTSDTTDEVHYFANWGIMGRFPWIFGIFHAFEPSSEIRGNYDLIERRLPLAANDPMCKGLVFWPECSHTDTLMLDYMSANAWKPSKVKLDDFLPDFCQNRYGKYSGEMLPLWRSVMNLARLTGWFGPQDPEQLPCAFSCFAFHLLSGMLVSLDETMLSKLRRQHNRYKSNVSTVPEVFLYLASLKIPENSIFIRRDVLDLARTLVANLQSYGFAKLALSMEAWRTWKCSSEQVTTLLESLGKTVELESSLLDAHEDYSLFDSLELLEKKHQTNPKFEQTLKGNAENFYCRTYASELFKGVYLPEMKVFSEWVTKKIRSGDRSEWRRPEEFEAWEKAIRDTFYATPLSELAPDHAKAARRLGATLKELSTVTEQILS